MLRKAHFSTILRLISMSCREASEEEIVEYFKTHGVVREYVQVSKRKELTKVALIRMERHEDAMCAKNALNRSDFKGRKLHVRWSNTGRVLWVSQLHESVTNEVRAECPDPRLHRCHAHHLTQQL